jgi:hypothetical protein
VKGEREIASPSRLDCWSLYKLFRREETHSAAPNDGMTTQVQQALRLSYLNIGKVLYQSLSIIDVCRTIGTV